MRISATDIMQGVAIIALTISSFLHTSWLREHGRRILKLEYPKQVRSCCKTMATEAHRKDCTDTHRSRA